MKSVQSIDLILYVLAKIKKASQLKLQKLAYYIECWHLAYFEKPILNEDFEAWVHGPVLRSVWDYMKERSITSLYSDIYLREDCVEKAIIEFEKSITNEQKELIENVLEEYSDHSAYYLENLTHSERPWKEARGTCGASDRCETHISKDTMKEFFQSKLA